MDMMKRGPWVWLSMIVLSLALLAGCDMSQRPAGTASTVTPSPTAPPTALPATPTALPAIPAPATTFTCPATINGAQKTFSDSQMQFSFSYPAEWTENSCQRFPGSGGQQTLIIGNLFSVTTMLRDGQTIEQWIKTHTNQYEVVTLGALTVQHAQEAATVTVTPSAISNPNQPFDSEPFAQTFAIVAGSHYFYAVTGFIAQNGITDTMPSLSRQQLAQQVVATFIVS